MTAGHACPISPLCAFKKADVALRILCASRPFTAAHAAPFRRIVLSFYKTAARDLPWRRTPLPYHVLVSEIMLQQTQVPRVAASFPRFIAAFPDFASLARAPLRDVLCAWHGLGYNRRALALKRIAEIVISEHNGELPRSPELLQQLPGIGAATAASIAAFAFNMPTVFLETNIRTVLIHYFFPRRRTVSDDELLPLAALTLDKKNPRRWYNALMDLGTMLKAHHGNASRRSARHRLQAKFEGSDRQLRGAILRALTAAPHTLIALCKICNATQDRLTPILSALQRDGLIRHIRRRYHIA